MTLEQIKDKIKSISLAHKSINGFDYGEDYLLATGKGTDYPLCFLEIPYNANYELSNNKFKTFQFALLILLNPSQDDLINDRIPWREGNEARYRSSQAFVTISILLH